MHRLTIIIIFSIFSHMTAKDYCSRIKIKKNVYKTPIKQFKKLNSDDEKLTFFKNKITEFKQAKYTHKSESCDYRRQNYQIEAIYKLYSYFNKIELPDFKNKCSILFYDFSILYINKLLTGPYFGKSKANAITTELKAIASTDRIYQKAINELKRIENWEESSTCDKILNLEIEKSKVQLRTIKYHKTTNDLFNDISFTSIDVIIENAIDNLEKVKKNYQNINCYSEKHENEIIILIDSLEQSY